MENETNQNLSSSQDLNQNISPKPKSFLKSKLIILILLIAVGIGVYFILQKSVTPNTNIPSCGDGICGPVEKANPSLCPQDCQQTSTSLPISAPTAIPAQPSSSNDSPFGIYSPYGEFKLDGSTFATNAEISGYLQDINAKWVQEMTTFKEFGEIPANFNIYSRIGREGGMSSDRINNSAIVGKYKSELTSVINSKKDKVKYWEVDTEPDGVGGWKNNPEGYVQLLKITYEIIKKECPDCKVMFGGLSGGPAVLNTQSKSFFEDVMKAGAAGYFDGVEFKQHHISVKEYSSIKNQYTSIGEVLSRYGLDINKMPIFVETAMYDGNPNEPMTTNMLLRNLPIQTEKEQAVGLVKTYMYGTSLGIDKIFWNIIFERADYEPNHATPFPQNPFNHYGLINNPTNIDGQSNKKLAYYSYKKMVEVLDGSDWSNIQTVQESNGVYVYKFTKGGKPIWVAWNDNPESKTVSLNVGSIQAVKITEAVPKYESGKDVTDYNSAFNTETKTATNGQISLTLNDVPVFVKE